MKKYILLMCFAGLMTQSCQEYLDVVPESDIQTIEKTFEQRTDAYDWLRTCYSMILQPTTDFMYNPAYWGTDEVVVDNYTRTNGYGAYNNHAYIPGVMIADGNQMAQTPYADVWTDKSGFYAAIRYCNLFLQNIDGVYNMSADEKQVWKGEIEALKAQYYFELMRRYGPFVLVPKNIDAAASIAEMLPTRATMDECVAATVELLDSAIARLPYMAQREYTDYNYFSKEGAVALKAMVLLYAASPLFNGNNMITDFKNNKGESLLPAYDKERWHRAALAADEALQIIAESPSPRRLVSGSSDRPTEILNVMRDLELSHYNYDYSNSESLLHYRDQGNEICRFYHPFFLSQYSYYYDYYAEGGMGASMAAVESYYTEHGLPLSEDKQWMSSRYSMTQETDDAYKNVVPLGQDVLSLHRRREPRFYADIAAHGTEWYRKRYGGTWEALYVDCRQGQMFGTTSKTYDASVPQCISGYYIKKFDRSETALKSYYYSNQGELGNMVFRLPDLLLASAEAWNEYLGAPDDRVYEPLNQVRRRAGIPDVEESWQTYARNPQKVKTQAGMREIIRQEWNNEFMFEGRRFWNLRRWLVAHEYLNMPQYGWNILSSDEKRFFNNGNGPIAVWKKRTFVSPRDYFFPIGSEEILISGVVQNPGWGSAK